MKEEPTFTWIQLCQVSLDTIKIALTNSAILIFPNPLKNTYSTLRLLNTDISEDIVQINDEETTLFLPITYTSGTFVGVQKNLDERGQYNLIGIHEIILFFGAMLK